MAEPKFNISELFSLAFPGTGTPVRYVAPSGQQSTSPGLIYDIPQITRDEISEMTELGTPILFPITFVGKGYQVYDQAGKLVNVDMKDFRMPASTICEFSREKADTITPLSGGVGSVKELYGFNDWTISIKGICMREGRHPQATDPYSQKDILYRWEKLADAVKVESDLLLALDIHYLYLQSIRFSQLPGKPYLVPFEIQALSDQPVELFAL